MKKLIIALTFLAACATGNEENTGISTERGPLGKADLVGSCSTNTDCDGQALDGSCWCDDACIEFGDCCSDRVEICEAPVAPVCGGFAGFQCGEGFYCDYEDDAQCGFADQTGVCREIPNDCTEALQPVCGCNGETFDNSCQAAQAGVSVKAEGTCGQTQPAVKHCGGLLAAGCAADEYCSYEGAETCGAGDQTGTCQKKPDQCAQVFAPVCGCNGVTYDNQCAAAMAGAAVAAAGTCAP